jgi:MFS family permease
MRFRLDSTIWNKGTVAAMLTESVIAYNMDAYSAGVPVWLQRMGFLSMVGVVMGVAILATLFGGLYAGKLIDKYGTRRVQGLTLLVMLVTSIGSSLANGWIEMMLLQTIRDYVCAIGIVSCGLRARALLLQGEEEQLRGLGQLNVLSYAVSAASAALGPWLVAEHMDFWRWLGPVITGLGLLEVLFNKHDYKPSVVSGNNGKINKDILKLVYPALGVSFVQGVVYSYLVVDVGVGLGSPVRAAINIAAGTAGLFVPMLVKKLGDKNTIRLLLLLLIGAVFGLVWPDRFTLIFSGLAIGTAQTGISIILVAKRPNTGSSASTHAFVDFGGAAFSSSVYGMVRKSMGVDASYAFLFLPVLFAVVGFERNYRSMTWADRGD